MPALKGAARKKQLAQLREKYPDVAEQIDELRSAPQVISTEVCRWAEHDYGASNPLLHDALRGDERELTCTMLAGDKEAKISIVENDAAHVEYGFSISLGENDTDLVFFRTEELLALPALLTGAIEEAKKIGMFARGPSLADWDSSQTVEGRERRAKKAKSA